jgi:hypothetical protein
MRALKLILGLLVVVILIVLGSGLVLPKQYRVERSIMVDASPEAVFDQVDNPGNWDAWFPWIARDTSIQRGRSGPYAGVGAKVTWTRPDSDTVSQTITRSEPFTRIETRLDLGEMGKPTADWIFESTDTGERVTVTFHGTARGPLGAYFAFTMDDRIGPAYELCLRRLKEHAEADDHADPILDIEEVTDADAGPEADAATP